VPAVRQKFHLSACADFRDRLFWNSVAFQIDNSAVFTVAADGTRSINNFKITPYVNPGKFENFDFVSSDFVAGVGGNQLQNDLDPSKIGRTVNFAFTDSIPTTIYTEDNFKDDAQTASTWTHPSFGTLQTEIRQLEDNLFNSGVAQYLIDGKPVLYSTIDGATLSPLLIQSQAGFGHYYLNDYVQNGIVEIGGPAADTLIGSVNDDILIGNEGADTIIAGMGSNYLDGGLDTDIALYELGGKTLILSSGGSAPTYPGFAPKDNAPFFTVDHVDGVDTLHSIEKIKLSTQADTLKIASGTDFAGLQEIDAGSQSSGTFDILDFSQFDHSISIAGGSLEGVGTQFINFEAYVGSTFSDTMKGGVGNDKFKGSAGDDILKGDSGNDYLDGGADTDTALYDDGGKGTLVLSSGGAAPFGFAPDDGDTAPFFTVTRGGESDVLHSIEKIRLSGLADTLTIAKDTDLTGLQEIDADSQPSDSFDVLDLRTLNRGFHDHKIDGFDTLFLNFEEIKLANGQPNDLTLDDTIKKVDGGDQEDTLTITDNNWAGTLIGGAGDDTVTFAASASSHSVSITAASFQRQSDDDSTTDGTGQSNTDDDPSHFDVTELGTGSISHLQSIETIELGGDNNRITVQSLDGTVAPSTITFDLGATSLESGATLDLSQYGTGVYLSSGQADDGASVALFSDEDYSQAVGLQFQNFNTLILSAEADKVELHSSDDPYLTQVYTGGGDDAVWSDIVNLQITLGDGHNRVEHTGQGTVINLGSGINEIFVSDDTLVVGAKPTDVFASVGGTILHGGLAVFGSESPWATGPDGTRYGLNSEGQLGIKDKSGAIMYIADYRGGPDVPYDEQTGSIFVGRLHWYAQRLMDLTRPSTELDTETIKAGNAMVYIKLGKKFFDSDPLVLDLNGDGIHLTPTSVVSPIFDINNTGFGIHTGWVQPDDGMLVYDKNGNGQVDSGRELFGGPGAVGFDALANYDLNTDGVIDANDDIYSQLQVWRDVNANARVDAGEMQSLAAMGITSISLATTEPENPNNAGNTINALGTFTRTGLSWRQNRERRGCRAARSQGLRHAGRSACGDDARPDADRRRQCQSAESHVARSQRLAYRRAADFRGLGGGRTSA
jgi:hypothetical protein